MIVKENILELASEGESELIEFKKTTGQRAEAAKTICAFLNRHGGTLLFGINDHGHVLGIEVTAKTLEDVAAEIRNELVVTRFFPATYCEGPELRPESRPESVIEAILSTSQ